MQTRTIVGLFAGTLLAGTSSMALAQSNNSGNPNWQDQSGSYSGSHNGYNQSAYGPNGYGQNSYGQNSYEQNQGYNQHNYDRWYDQQPNYNGNQTYGMQQGPNSNNQQGYNNNQRQFGQNQNSSLNNIPEEIRQKLQYEGYSNIKIEPGSFVVSATDADGDPVLMVFGPDSATMIRSIDQGNQNNATQGSGLHENNGFNRNNNYNNNNNPNNNYNPNQNQEPEE